MPMKEIADEALESAPTVTHTVVWRRLGLDDVPMTIGRDRFWDELVADTSGDLTPKQVDSEHPYLLAYTSGTTGKPKGALHVQGGFLVVDRARGRVPDERQAGRPHPLRDRHGLDHGPVDGRRRRRVRSDRRLRGGRARLSGRPALAAVESERVTMLGVSPTLVRALDPQRRARGRPVAR